MGRDTSAFSLPGTLNAPAGYGGMNAPVTGGTAPADSAPQVTKAVNSMGTGNGSPASADAESVKNGAAVVVLTGLVFLWIMGGIVFKNAKF
jgi:hypothetical protein